MAGPIFFPFFVEENEVSSVFCFVILLKIVHIEVSYYKYCSFA